MKKAKSTICFAILFLASVWAQPASAQVLVNDGALELEGIFGIGGNTSYFVIDFSGAPSGSGDSFAFGYQWDAPNTTPADGLFEIAANSSLQVGTTDFGGTLGLGLDTLTFGADTDTPDFNVDGRFWTIFADVLENGLVDWNDGPAGFGISGGAPNPDGSLPGALVDGGFVGFRAQTFGAPDVPAIPVSAIPEPSGLLLLGVASLANCARRRRNA